MLCEGACEREHVANRQFYNVPPNMSMNNMCAYEYVVEYSRMFRVWPDIIV
jgi:hypothetical protein